MIWRIILWVIKKLSLQLQMQILLIPTIIQRHHKYKIESPKVDLTNFCIKSSQCSVEVMEIYSYAFLAKISWKQRFYWRSYLELTSRNMFMVGENFLFFHRVLLIANYVCTSKFQSNLPEKVNYLTEKSRKKSEKVGRLKST